VRLTSSIPRARNNNLKAGDFEAMPADVEEVDQAEDEGLHMALLTIPKAILGENGHLTGLKCICAKVIKKEHSERMFPVPVEGSDFIIDADAVISAIGQRGYGQPCWAWRGGAPRWW
jgi:NADPH-dependent glutamate synthase beta subunit-like oxidoreductase